MGLRRYLFVQMACARCSGLRRAEVTFETGSDRLERYEQDEIIADGEGLRTSREYEGRVAHYCPNCYLQFQQSLVQTKHNALALMVEEGSLELFHEGTKTPFSPAEIRTIGAELARGKSSEGEDFSADLLNADAKYRGADAIHVFELLEQDPNCTITFDDEGRMTGPEPAVVWQSCWSHFSSLTNDMMLQSGWIFGSEYLNTNLIVYLDRDRRLKLRAMKSADRTG